MFDDQKMTAEEFGRMCKRHVEYVAFCLKKQVDEAVQWMRSANPADCEAEFNDRLWQLKSAESSAREQRTKIQAAFPFAPQAIIAPLIAVEVEATNARNELHDALLRRATA